MSIYLMHSQIQILANCLICYLAINFAFEGYASYSNLDILLAFENTPHPNIQVKIPTLFHT